jgi:hypothetical protein
VVYLFYRSMPVEVETMAIFNAIYSFTIQDADGERTAFPVYVEFADTVTLADVNTGLMAYGSLLDAILDGQIVKNRVTVELPVDSGYKSAPVAGSEIEVTGLITFSLDDPVGKTYSNDIPAFARSKFVGNKINLTDADVAAWISRGVSATPPAEKNDLWSGFLLAVRSGRKTFRKHRRQTERT